MLLKPDEQPDDLFQIHGATVLTPSGNRGGLASNILRFNVVLLTLSPYGSLGLPSYSQP